MCCPKVSRVPLCVCLYHHSLDIPLWRAVSTALGLISILVPEQENEKVSLPQHVIIAEVQRVELQW